MSMQIVMPKAGLTMVEGTISRWMVAEGASVNKGDVIMEYENEKSIIPYEALDSGIIHLIAKEGDTVAVGERIGELAESPDAYKAMTSTNDTASSVSAAAPAPVPAPPVSRPGGHVRATGLAKKMAKEAGVDIGDIPSTGGPDGSRIVAKDVAAYLNLSKNQPAHRTPAVSMDEKEEIREIPWTGMRKVIARNMFNSLQESAQCTSVCEMDVTELMALRQKLIDKEAFLGCRISVNDLLCMATVRMLANHPVVNATFDGKTLFTHKHVNLSVAVATDNGLMVPVVKGADALSLRELSDTIKDLSIRAKNQTLRPDEQTGGTFTVSNVGMFSTDFATPIINLPEVAILGFGRTSKKPCYIDDQLVPRDRMYVYLTFDHRVLDGQEVGGIFQDMQQLIEHPELITV